MSFTTVDLRKVICERILDILADNIKGLTVQEIQKELAKLLGWSMSDGSARNRINDLIDENKVHALGVKKRALVYHLGPEPIPAGEPKIQAAKVLEPSPAPISLQEALRYKALNDRLDQVVANQISIEKKLVTLLNRSEYSAKAMITIQRIASDLGVDIAATKAM